MSRSLSPTIRRLLVSTGLALMLITAGCTGGTNAAADDPDTPSDPDKTLERSSENLNVYTDNTAITVVKYPNSRTKTIYWEDQTVCTRFQSANEGGAGCLPFNETKVDERYDPPTNT